jgi:hypothetical protein
MADEGEDTTHQLQYPWTFTYFKKVAAKSYEENTYTLGTTSTVRTSQAQSIVQADDATTF